MCDSDHEGVQKKITELEAKLADRDEEIKKLKHENYIQFHAARYARQKCKRLESLISNPCHKARAVGESNLMALLSQRVEKI